MNACYLPCAAILFSASVVTEVPPTAPLARRNLFKNDPGHRPQSSSFNRDHRVRDSPNQLVLLFLAQKPAEPFQWGEWHPFISFLGLALPSAHATTRRGMRGFISVRTAAMSIERRLFSRIVASTRLRRADSDNHPHTDRCSSPEDHKFVRSPSGRGIVRTSWCTSLWLILVAASLARSYAEPRPSSVRHPTSPERN